MRRKRTGADERLEQLDHFSLAGISRSKEELTADDHKMLGIPKWPPALLLPLRPEDRLELFSEGRGHLQAFDNHVVQSGSGDRVQRHSGVLGFSDELRILQRFQESRFHGTHAIPRHAGGMA